MRIELSLDLCEGADVREALPSSVPADAEHYRYTIGCRQQYDDSRYSFESDAKTRAPARECKRYDSELRWLEDPLNAHHLVYGGETTDVVR